MGVKTDAGKSGRERRERREEENKRTRKGEPQLLYISIAQIFRQTPGSLAKDKKVRF